MSRIIFPQLDEHYTLPVTYSKLGLKPLDEFLRDHKRGASTWMCATIARILEQPHTKCILHESVFQTEGHLSLIRKFTSQLKKIKAKQYSSQGITYTNGSEVHAPLKPSFLTPGNSKDIHFISEYWDRCLQSRLKPYYERIDEVYQFEDQYMAWGEWGDALGLVSYEDVQKSKCTKIIQQTCLV